MRRGRGRNIVSGVSGRFKTSVRSAGYIWGKWEWKLKGQGLGENRWLVESNCLGLVQGKHREYATNQNLRRAQRQPQGRLVKLMLSTHMEGSQLAMSSTVVSTV